MRTGFLRLAGAHAVAEVHRRQTEARSDHPDGRAHAATAARHRSRAVIKQALIRGAPAASWLAQMLARKPRMLVAVALANKMGRMVWALLARGGIYRAPVLAA